MDEVKKVELSSTCEWGKIAICKKPYIQKVDLPEIKPYVESINRAGPVAEVRKRKATNYQKGAGYDALGWVKDKILDTGKWVVGKGREYEKMAEEKCNTASSSDVELKSNEQDKKQETDKGKVVGPFTQKEAEKNDKRETQAEKSR
ncbi:hypothetical protein TNIN_54601 [Trichonephila inaurata madagascariensis]|uniref:Uncharacterized protein n=1 Tax=Trichonephila inaurata madagascariensis TaxID=2747483 RepID=A0A8X6YWP5_9ARAC|nr:hypothetical protein TNIN_54601 [Trichonephila inaurata madagascariensis]